MRTTRRPQQRRSVKWGGQDFSFGKRATRAAPEFSTAPHCAAVDGDFDSFNSLTLDRQDGRLQRVTLGEVA